MLVHLKEIVRKAQAEGYGLGAFNTSNLEVTKAIIEAALAKNSPIIIQVSEATINYVGLLPVTNLIKTFAQNSGAKIPVVIHLDHGKNFQIIKACLKAGFRSVHIDASDMPLDENINLTKNLSITILLQPNVVEMEGVTISSEKPDQNVTSIQSGTVQLDAKEIAQLPTLMGEPDLINSFRTLPGVQGVGEGNPGLYVRGGDAGQNLMLLDQMPLYNPSHLVEYR